VKILDQARHAAQEIFDHDPDLREPEYQALGERVNEFWKAKGDLS
jgi:hypothetical protein